MSDELKPCPNRKCRNDRVGTLSRMLDASGLSQAFGECPMCGTRGPMVAAVTMVDAEAKAREAWNDLPRHDAPTLRDEVAAVLAQLDALMAFRGRDDPAFREPLDRLRAALERSDA